MGLLFELGPCTIQLNGSESSSSASSRPYTTVNPWSWTRYANIIFLDQPVGVGFSYFSNPSSSNHSTEYPVSTSHEAALDVYAFLQLFYAHFPETKTREFHMAGESYGGHYVPHIGKVIWEMNKEMELERQKEKKSEQLGDDGEIGTTTIPPRVSSIDPIKIPLTSIFLVDALTEPLTQFDSMPEYYCNGPYPLWRHDSPVCDELKEKMAVCKDLIKKCYECGNENEACSLSCYTSSECLLCCLANHFSLK